MVGIRALPMVIPALHHLMDLSLFLVGESGLMSLEVLHRAQSLLFVAGAATAVVLVQFSNFLPNVSVVGSIQVSTKICFLARRFFAATLSKANEALQSSR